MFRVRARGRFRVQGLGFSLQTQRPAAYQRVGRASFFSTFCGCRGTKSMGPPVFWAPGLRPFRQCSVSPRLACAPPTSVASGRHCDGQLRRLCCVDLRLQRTPAGRHLGRRTESMFGEAFPCSCGRHVLAALHVCGMLKSRASQSCRGCLSHVLGLSWKTSVLPAHPLSQHPWFQDDNVRASSTSTVPASMAQG